MYDIRLAEQEVSLDIYGCRTVVDLVRLDQAKLCYVVQQAKSIVT